ncbi:hypothetical protein D3C72_2116690 [compost metagenome]
MGSLLVPAGTITAAELLNASKDTKGVKGLLSVMRTVLSSTASTASISGATWRPREASSIHRLSEATTSLEVIGWPL